MAINLKKGQSIVLEKEKYDLSSVTMGLGWDVAEPKKGGFFKSLFTSTAEFDLDGFALFLGDNGKLLSGDGLIYFGNLESKDGTIKHTGDNLTGEGEGDDEQINIKLGSLSPKLKKVVLAVNIYEGQGRGQHFGLIHNAFVRAVDASGQEMARFSLSKSPEYDGKTCMLLGEMNREGDKWKFQALGTPLDVSRIEDVQSKFM